MVYANFVKYINKIQTVLSVSIVNAPFKMGSFAIFMLLFPVFTFAQEQSSGASRSILEAAIKDTSLKTAYVAGGLIIVLTLLSVITKGKTEKFKRILFFSMAALIIIPTTFFAFSTIYLNIISDTKGPVHWHADYQIFNCGEEIFLSSPASRWSNKVGTAEFHHHADNRIHVEGVVVNTEDFYLDDFFRVVGGNLTQNSFTVPAEDGDFTLQNGDLCPSGLEGSWQVFIYEVVDFENNIVEQRKLDNYTNHLLSPHAAVPPGDCIIFEFTDQTKEKTNRLCTFYKIAEEQGDITIR